MRKVEDGFNFVWHVDVPRSFARRMAEYLTLLVTGPLLLAAVVGLSRLAAEQRAGARAVRAAAARSRCWRWR